MSLPSPPASPRDGDNVKLFINERVSEEKSQNDADESKENIESLPSYEHENEHEEFLQAIARGKWDDDGGVMDLKNNLFDYGDKHVRFGFGKKNLISILERLDMFLVKHFS